ncbi:MAG: dodecin family protein, partial [Methyloceanibacter sp.]
ESTDKVVNPESVYDVIELIGTSTESWEDAAKNVMQAGQHLRQLRVAEVVAKDSTAPRSKSPSNTKVMAEVPALLAHFESPITRATGHAAFPSRQKAR